MFDTNAVLKLRMKDVNFKQIGKEEEESHRALGFALVTSM